MGIGVALHTPMQFFRYFAVLLLMGQALKISAMPEDPCVLVLSTKLLTNSTVPQLSIKVVAVTENPADPYRKPTLEDEAWITQVLQSANAVFYTQFPVPDRLLKIHIHPSNGHTSYNFIKNKMKLDQQDVKGRHAAVLLHEYGHTIFSSRLFLLNPILTKAPILAVNVSAPYNEVFADLTAGLFCGDGACHYDVILNRQYDFYFDQVNSKERFARLRDMTKFHTIEEIIAIDRYTYGKKYSTSMVNSHLILTQARSYLWQAYVKHQIRFKNPADFLNLVYKVFKDEILLSYGQHILGIKKPDPGLEAINHNLIQAFEKELNTYLHTEKD